MALQATTGKMSSFRQTPLTCSGHTRPVVDLDFSDITQYGYFMISACKGIVCPSLVKYNFVVLKINASFDDSVVHKRRSRRSVLRVRRAMCYLH